jgi:hypothetical protein
MFEGNKDPNTDPKWRNWMLSVGLPLPGPLDMPDASEDEEELGSTNFSHGQGYPNPSKKSRDIFFIYDIADDDATEENKRSRHLNIDTIKILNKKYPEFVKKWRQSFKTLYGSRVSSHLRYYNWDKMTPEEKKIVEFSERVENFLRDKKYYQADATNPKNYPLYVTAYDLTRQYGGAEEGGWYYDHYDPVESIQVNTPEETRIAAARLYKMMKGGDLDGQLKIYVERHKGSQEQGRPDYS